MLRHEKPEERIAFFVPESVVLPEGFKEGAEKHNIEIIRGSIPGGVTGVTGVMSLRPERKLRVIVKMPRRGTGVTGVTGVTGWKGAHVGSLVARTEEEGSFDTIEMLTGRAVA
ncbi:hypothetical protein ES703_48465 [subsurface metagenome]